MYIEPQKIQPKFLIRNFNSVIAMSFYSIVFWMTLSALVFFLNPIFPSMVFSSIVGVVLFFISFMIAHFSYQKKFFHFSQLLLVPMVFEKLKNVWTKHNTYSGLFVLFIWSLIEQISSTNYNPNAQHYPRVFLFGSFLLYINLFSLLFQWFCSFFWHLDDTNVNQKLFYKFLNVNPTIDFKLMIGLIILLSLIVYLPIFTFIVFPILANYTYIYMVESFNVPPNELDTQVNIKLVPIKHN